MGMAASQARLLALTARIHDTEFQAQTIQNAKLQLATQQDQVYQDYLDALDATTFTIKTKDGDLVPANFNTLCGINRVNTGNTCYALRDSKNRLIVPDEVLSDYIDFKRKATDIQPQNANTFAMFCCNAGVLSTNAIQMGMNAVLNDSTKTASLEQYKKNMDEAYKELVKAEPEKSSDGSTFLKEYNDRLEIYNQKLAEGTATDDDNPGTLEEAVRLAIDTCYDEKDKKNIQEKYDNYLKAQEAYFEKMYQFYAEDVYEQSGCTGFDQADFDYYKNMYQQIEAAGGEYACVAISEFNGIDDIGNAATDGDWLQNQIKSGEITIDTVTIKDGKAVFKGTGVSTDSNLAYTTTTSIDKKAMAKAEAEYQHKLKEIDRKDKRFDQDLSKLETERSALTTEYESVKKVVDENIERSFKIFS